MRAIIHLDLDCFYCQVEQVRKGIKDHPLCVQQWNGILSVNYEARALGVTRQWTAADVREKLPDVILAHVPVLQMGETKPIYSKNSNISTQKTSLSTYRNASIEIMKLIQSVCQKFQKASIDEAYMDVTDLVNGMLEERGWSENTVLHWPQDTFHAVEPVETSSGLDDARLFLACEISQTVRKLINEKLGFTASTGIACNKTLAKLISSLNKPNKQTVLRNCNILEYMKPIPFSKIKGLGGKFGKEAVEHFSVEYASDLWKFSVQELQSKFGNDSGKWLFDICRGVCNDQVSKTQLAKSIQSIKSFNKKLTSLDHLKKWIFTMSAEIYDRAHEDLIETGRWPKNLAVSISVGQVILKHFKFPHRESMEDHLVLFHLIWKSIESEPKKLPVGHISMVLNGLEKVNTNSIMNWAKPVRLEKLDTNESIHPPQSHKEEMEMLLSTTDENGNPVFFKCLECGAVISTAERQTHQDHHFAMALSREVVPPPKEVKQGVPLPKAVKRKADSKLEKLKADQKKADFFKPRGKTLATP